MKKWIILCFIIAHGAFAVDGYRLEMEISKNGKVISKPKVIVVKGEKATIIQSQKEQSTEIDMVATEGEIMGRKGILLDLEIFDKDKNLKKEMISKAELLLDSGKEAFFEIGDTLSDEKLSFKVKATRTSR